MWIDLDQLFRLFVRLFWCCCQKERRSPFPLLPYVFSPSSRVCSFSPLLSPTTLKVEEVVLFSVFRTSQRKPSPVRGRVRSPSPPTICWKTFGKFCSEPLVGLFSGWKRNFRDDDVSPKIVVILTPLFPLKFYARPRGLIFAFMAGYSDFLRSASTPKG